MAEAARTRVLVIDDDEGVRALVSDVLAREGHDVVAAASGDEGIAAMNERPPDLVISDVQMPGGSGYEVCRHLRERFGDVPFMFLSGTRMESYDRVAGFAVGADDYLLKPFDPEELAARARALLRRTQRASAPPPAAAGLTPREVEILQWLARGLSQSEIAEQLVLSPKTVGKHIERVLRKLRVRSRAEAVSVAYRHGLVEPPEAGASSSDAATSNR